MGSVEGFCGWGLSCRGLEVGGGGRGGGFIGIHASEAAERVIGLEIGLVEV